MKPPPPPTPVMKPISNTTITRGLVLVTSLTLLLLIYTSTLTTFTNLATSPPKQQYHSLFLTHASNSTAARHLFALTTRPHLAGSASDSAVADYVAAVFSSHSFRPHVSSHPVLLSLPVHRSLSLQTPPEPKLYDFSLVQDIYEGDPYANVAGEVVPTFHAYAKSGTAVGEVVYVNYGRVEDYERLREIGIEVSGAVALARYGKIYRGDIVRNAELAGAVGVVIYTDRADYGGGKDEKLGFPNGKWMPESGVQIGTVYRGVGDPSTPGWGSKEGCERLREEEVEKLGGFPGIPSLPVSARDGDVIHREIGGAVADDGWQGSGDKEMAYKLGPGPGVLNLTYLGKNEVATIHNVFGIIEGEEEPDRYVLLGNHRDAWTFGAADPNSGTATLLEIAERLHKLHIRGWRPRRTIMLCNWDAEEYGLVGSTEWVETNREMIASKVVAYLNVDVAVAGPGFHVSSTPQLDDLIKEATHQVRDPDNSSQSLYESWIGANASPLIERLGGGGSDFAAFVQHVGIPSADMFFGGDYPVYHSMYDDFVWMEKYGDPMFQRHVAAGSIWGLVALKLADEEFLPFNYLSYAYVLQVSTKELEDILSDTSVSVNPIYNSIEELKKAAVKINSHKKALQSNTHLLNWRKDPLGVRELNDRLMMAERAFTNQEGLFGRTWYKHLIYGPSEHDDYGSKSFPGVDDALRKARNENNTKSWQSVQHEVWRVARVISQVSLVLNGEFS